jgi:hypothetical protein
MIARRTRTLRRPTVAGKVVFAILFADGLEFDVCKHTLGGWFDLIIADLFEHLERPVRAAANAHTMILSGGLLIVQMPPAIDCSRSRPEGLVYPLVEGGFPKHLVHSDGWGKRARLNANLSRRRKRGFRSLRNKSEFPVIVWAFATKPQEAQWV